MLVPSMRADLGVMISASHNPFADNGIKLFGPDGYKLSDTDEAQIEVRLTQEPKLAEPAQIGRAKRIEDARGRYINAVKQSLPKARSEERRVGKECVSQGRSRGSPNN